MMLRILDHFSLNSKNFSLWIICVGMCLPVFAQPRRSCGTMQHLDEQVKANPSILRRMRLIEDQTQYRVKSGAQGVTGTIVIPVVIHVVYNEKEQNISEAQIRSQFKVLNEDFQRLNRDRVNTPKMFGAVAASPDIRFELAQLDPQGDPTSGITRHRTHVSAFYSSDNGVKYSAMGGVDPWPTTEYLNIWVCNLGMGILGYSQFPGGAAETDGVVIGYKFFGTTGPIKAPFNLGRTTTHEVGHWLNLRHIWGDGPCDVDDLVADTPPASGPNHGCAFGHSACGSINMTQNFMDYTDDACMNLFTKGQADRMRLLFAPGGSRSSLLKSKALIKDKPIPVAYVAPSGLEVSVITENTARMSWAPVKGALSYRVRMRRVGSDKWMPRNFTRTFVNATKLRPCTEYEFQLESIFSKVSSGFTESNTFKTDGCSVNEPIAETDWNPSSIPTNLVVSGIQGSRAMVSWKKVARANSYKIQFKIAGYTGVKTVESRGNMLKLSGLQAGRRYYFRVQANVNGKAGRYSKIKSFMAGTHMTARLSADPTEYMKTSPAIVREWVEVDFAVEKSMHARISISNTSGRLVKSYKSFLIEPHTPFELDCRRLSPGRYMIRIEDEDGFEYEKPITVR